MGMKWEQAQPGVDGGDDVLDRYLQDDTPANGSGPGSFAQSGQGMTSGDSVDQEAEVDQRVIARLESYLDEKLKAMRQDLQTYADRTAQSYSDKTAHRLTQQQSERLQALDRALSGLEDVLGPDFDAIKRQKQLDILLDGGRTDNVAPETPRTPSAPEASQPTDFADAYLSSRLGDPSQFSEDDLNVIRSELSQARDMNDWITRVDRLAQNRARQAPPESTQGSADTSAARMQPVSLQGSRRSNPSLEQLDRALNRAAAEGDLKAVEEISKQIDEAVRRLR